MSRRGGADSVRYLESLESLESLEGLESLGSLGSLVGRLSVGIELGPAVDAVVRGFAPLSTKPLDSTLDAFYRAG